MNNYINNSYVELCLHVDRVLFNYAFCEVGTGPLLYRDIAGRLRQRRLCSVVQRYLCICTILLHVQSTILELQTYV